MLQPLDLRLTIFLACQGSWPWFSGGSSRPSEPNRAARLGFLVTFLGHPVTSGALAKHSCWDLKQGFTSGAAIIIGFSQLKYMLGVHLEKPPGAAKSF